MGDALALAGSVCAAIYLLLGRSLRRKLSQTSSTFGVIGFAMFVVIVVLTLAVIRP